MQFTSVFYSKYIKEKKILTLIINNIIQHKNKIRKIYNKSRIKAERKQLGKLSVVDWLKKNVFRFITASCERVSKRQFSNFCRGKFSAEENC